MHGWLTVIFSRIKAAGLWVEKNAAPAFGLAIGSYLLGLLTMSRVGYSFRDSNAVSFVVGLVGVAGAIGAGLWAATSKQRMEDHQREIYDRHKSSMISSALTPEIASARMLLSGVAGLLDKELKEAAESLDITSVAHTLSRAEGRAVMLETFISDLECFGGNAAKITLGVGAVLEHNAEVIRLSMLLGEMCSGSEFDFSEVKQVVEQRIERCDSYAKSLTETLSTLRTYHPEKYNDALWKSWVRDLPSRG